MTKARVQQVKGQGKAMRAGAEGKVLFLTVVCRKPVMWRKLDKEKVTVEADKSQLNFEKRILNSDALGEVSSVDNRVKSFLRSRCLPACFLQDGMYAIPVTAIEEVGAFLTEKAKERRELVVKLIEEYPRLKEEAKTMLGSVYLELDYPSPDALAQAFDLEWKFVDLGTPTDLETISEALYQEEQRKAKASWEQLMAEWTRVLYTEARKLCADMVTRLEPGKRFSDDSLAYMRKWVDLFAERNVVNDKALADLVEEMRGVLDNQVSDLAKALRDKESDFRSEVQASFAKVRDRVEVEAKRRRITFTKEE